LIIVEHPTFLFQEIKKQTITILRI
jgi:hypothetical protein